MFTDATSICLFKFVKYCNSIVNHNFAFNVRCVSVLIFACDQTINVLIGMNEKYRLTVLLKLTHFFRSSNGKTVEWMDGLHHWLVFFLFFLIAWSYSVMWFYLTAEWVSESRALSTAKTLYLIIYSRSSICMIIARSKIVQH